MARTAQLRAARSPARSGACACRPPTRALRAGFRLLQIRKRPLQDVATPVVTAPAAVDPPAFDRAQWYKDAIIYQLHIKAFFDSNDDGVGDFRGLTDKLDYIRDLGVNTIWLLPFYPSPLRDDGYDVAD